LSGIPFICCVCVPAPLIPEVALVELPPMKLDDSFVSKSPFDIEMKHIPLLVKEEYVGTSFKESVCSRKASKTSTDDNNLSHCGCERG